MAIPPQALLIGANVRFCDGCAFWSVDRWLSGGRWPVDNIRPLMADMQAANLGVDHYGARAVGPAGQDESLWWAAPISNRG
jgi:hypothetical protein